MSDKFFLLGFLFFLVACSGGDEEDSFDADVNHGSGDVVMNMKYPWGEIKDGLKARVIEFQHQKKTSDVLGLDFKVEVENANSSSKKIAIGPMTGTEGAPDIVVQTRIDLSWRDIGSHWLNIDIGDQNILEIPPQGVSQFVFSVRTKVPINLEKASFRVVFGSDVSGGDFWTGFLETGPVEINLEK